MVISLVSVGQKITATLVNSIIGAVNGTGMAICTPSSVGGTGVSMVSVGRVALSNATTANINGIFTSTYTNYRIVINITLGSASALSMVLRASGVDETGANYDTQVMTSSNSTTSSAQLLGGSIWPVGASSSLVNHVVTMDLFGPAVAAACSGIGTAWAWSNPLTTAASIQTRGVAHQLTNAYDGITILASGGATGTVLIYGYNQG